MVHKQKPSELRCRECDRDINYCKCQPEGHEKWWKKPTTENVSRISSLLHWQFAGNEKWWRFHPFKGGILLLHPFKMHFSLKTRHTTLNVNCAPIGYNWTTEWWWSCWWYVRSWLNSIQVSWGRSRRRQWNFNPRRRVMQWIRRDTEEEEEALRHAVNNALHVIIFNNYTSPGMRGGDSTLLLFNKDDRVLFSCRELIKSNFQELIINGWRMDGIPTQTNAQKEKKKRLSFSIFSKLLINIQFLLWF